MDSLAQTVDWPGEEFPSAAARPSADAAMPSTALDLDYVAAVLDTTLQAHRLLRETRVERADDRLVLAMPADLLFATGETKVADEALPPLEALARVLENLSNPVGILGHAGRSRCRTAASGRTGSCRLPAPWPWRTPSHARALRDRSPVTDLLTAT